MELLSLAWQCVLPCCQTGCTSDPAAWQLILTTVQQHCDALFDLLEAALLFAFTM